MTHLMMTKLAIVSTEEIVMMSRPSSFTVELSLLRSQSVE